MFTTKKAGPFVVRASREMAEIREGRRASLLIVTQEADTSSQMVVRFGRGYHSVGNVSVGKL